jgi:hypothetical protein
MLKAMFCKTILEEEFSRRVITLPDTNCRVLSLSNILKWSWFSLNLRMEAVLASEKWGSILEYHRMEKLE